MRPDGKSPNFVFFDLSKLDAASASAFLTDLSRRTGSSAFPPDQSCHWIVNPLRSHDLLAAPGMGPSFFRDRLARGDRLFCTNPTGFDWSHLFPSEADQEARVLSALVTQEAFLFLENTPRAPEWLASLGRTVFRASPEGLCVLDARVSVCLPWASRDRNPNLGVWWIVPGQAILTGLPGAPWADLVGALPQLSRGQQTTGKLSPVHAPTPKGKQAMDEIGALRRSAGSAPLHQEVLFHPQDYPGLGTRDAVDFEEALGGIRKRSLVANMQGLTDLREVGLRAQFQGGRLVRLEDTHTGGVLCSGTDTFLEWAGKRHRFTVNSAFSFEGDYSWGLRQSLMLNHEDLLEPGRAILDYYFVEESREFFVAVTVRWPRWKAPVTVTGWAPLEMTLFSFPWVDPLSTRVVWPDGRSSDRIHRVGAAGVLAGTDFVFAGGKKSLVLGFPQNQTPRPYLLPWRLERGWSHARLVVSPEGGHGPRKSSEFDGIEEHFSFYLTPAEGAKLPFAVTRKQAAELIPPYVIESDTAVAKDL